MATKALRTQDDVYRLLLPKDRGEVVYFDEGKDRERVSGLALRIRAAGSRKWVYFYRWGGRLQKLTIGSASDYSLDEARKRARSQRALIDSNKNPILEQRTGKQAQKLRPTTFASVARDYLEARQPEMKPRSYEEVERHIAQHWKPLHRLDIVSIDRPSVASILRAIVKERGAVSANRARSTLSAMFAWAIGEGLVDANPVTGTNKAAENEERDRTLTDAEMAALWSAVPDSDYGLIVQLLLLTGCRRDEIGGLSKSEVDWDVKTITLPAERTKNNREHVVPLSMLALDVLARCTDKHGRDHMFGRKRGFAGWGAAKRNLDAVITLTKPWTLHDLRRTVRTGMGALGVLPHVSEAVLNHLPPKLVRTYDRNKYESEKRAALDLWAGHVRVILAKADGANVVRMAQP